MDEDHKMKVKVDYFNPLFVLGVVFLVLKLAEVIDWSWWIVLLPFYFGIAVGLAIILFVVAFGLFIFIALLISGIVQVIWECLLYIFKR